MRRLGLATLALAMAACSNPVDDTENVLPTGDDPDTGGGTDTTGGSGDCDCVQVGDWYAFTQLELVSVDGDTETPLVDSLNGIWRDDLARGELNLLFEVTAVETDSVVVRAMSGARLTGGTDVCALEATSVEVTLPKARCAVGPSPEAGINIYSGTVDNPKSCSTTLPVQHAIPIERVVLEGNLTDTCDELVGGRVVSGVLAQDALGQICSCLQLGQSDATAEDCGRLDPAYDKTGCAGCNGNFTNLATLLPILGEPDWACETGTGGAGACVEAAFDASRLDVSVPPCP
jgi:hypothetical protein